MGIYDRDYIRDDEGSFAGGPQSMVTRLIAINVVVYLVQIFFFRGDSRFLDLFGLRPDLLLHPQYFYQLLTYGFLHSTQDILHIIFNMILLWFVGREMESIYGKRGLLEFYLSTIILSGLTWVLYEQILAGGLIPALQPSGRPLVGASGGVTGVAMVFVMHYPRRMVNMFFILPMPIWLVAAIFLGFDLFKSLWPDPNDNVARSAHLAGAALGYLFYRTRWQLFSLLPTRWLAGLLKGRPKVRIHQPDEPDTDEAALRTEVDRILEKISRQGEDSLSARERGTLEDASRRYQKRRR